MTRSQEHYRSTAGHLDTLVYELCVDRLSHTDPAKLYAKTALIARGYKTNIETMIMVPRDGHGGLDLLVDTLGANASLIGEGIAFIREAGDDLTVDALGRILSVHGRLSAVLTKIVRRPGQRAAQGASAPARASPRSFVSKYLHCHAPTVPLYDAWVDRPTRMIVKRVPVSPDLTAVTPVDPVYRSFAIRFWTLYRRLREFDPGAAFTVRELDYYLVTRARYRS